MASSSSAQAAYLEAMIADDFHDPPAFHGRKLVVPAVQIRDANDAHWLNRSFISTVGFRGAGRFRPGDSC